ncbi:MAG: toxin-antitoxin system YwqK family antitoxin, partial [Bacteroidota bacterium]|nr:toxin-antitoxin system YwqK family antitoxin [Bacteroidota bacterium]
MKKNIIIISFLFVCFSTAFTQEIHRNSKGLYIDKNNELFTGLYIEYYEDSSVLSKINISKGIQDGLTILYFDNGSKMEIRSYKKGKKHGKWLNWNLDKIKIAEARYKNNIKHGKWYIWDNNGVLRY